MTSKERVLTAFANRAPDRVPIDYSANPGIDGRLYHFYCAVSAARNRRMGEIVHDEVRGISVAVGGPQMGGGAQKPA